jgi:hypothetical protein
MIEKTFDAIVEMAKDCKTKSVNWHFHMLGKNCKFNESNDKYCIVFENEATKEKFFSFFDNKPLDQAEILAKLVYGQDFMERDDKSIENPEMKKLTARARELSKKKADWHHHHLHPNCIFNNHKGHHVAILEDPQKGETLEAIIDENPAAQLKEIEKLFYNK